MSRRLNDVQRNDFTPREYQTELYQKCVERNTIVCLETGGGKTFIAVMLIKHFSHQLEDPEQQSDDPNDLNNIGKRTIFLVPTIPLVNQQAKAIEMHTNLKVGKFFGEEFDYYTKFEWLKEMKKYQVFVMIHEIFRMVIHHGFIPLSKLNLLIFDEVHHATKNHPYREIMTCFDNCPVEDQPRIMGLSASLINNSISPAKLEESIKSLENTMRSNCDTTCDIRSLNKYAAKPKEVICYYEQYDASKLIKQEEVLEALKIIQDLADNFLKYNICDVKLEFPDMPVDVKKLKKILQDVKFNFKEMGFWCAKKLAELYIKELNGVTNMISSNRSIHSSIINAVISGLNAFRTAIKKYLNGFDLKEQLLKFASPKLRCLFNILVEYNDLFHKQNESDKSNLCAIIFIQRRSSCKVMSKWLDELSKISSEFNFIKVDYVVGSASHSSTTIAHTTINSQEQTLNKFRNCHFNILTATKVLEEGLDVPRCNLVVRFDFPQNFREYVQSKGRARAENGHFIIMTTKEIPLLKSIYNYKNIEIILNEKTQMRKPPTEKESLESFEDDTLMEPYMPIKKDGAPRVTMNSSISLINRYCMKLPSDSFTRLTPQFTFEEFHDDQLGIEGRQKKFICILSLPINSPVRHEIVSLPMPTRMAAKKSAALLACKALHQAHELDDNLLPVGKESNIDHEDQDLNAEQFEDEKNIGKNDPRPGTAKRRQYYTKRVADMLSHPLPTSDTNCYLYEFTFELIRQIPEEHNTRGRKICDPGKTIKNFGILNAHPIPPICPFPLFTRSGEVEIKLQAIKIGFKLSQNQIDKLINFHRFTFVDVLRLIKSPLIFNPDKSSSRYLVVPIDFKDGIKEIDWDFVDLIDKQKESPLRIVTEEERRNFVFQQEKYLDAVVFPWYRLDKPQYFYYVAEIVHELNPNSPFPDDGYQTFAHYFQKKYNINIVKQDQPLLDVDHTSYRLNLLTPRYINRKGITLPTSTEKTKKEKRENLQQKQILIPELCHIHAFSASFWRKVVCLPSILFRLNSLLVAEQLRSQIAKETSIGLVNTKNISWKPLEFEWTVYGPNHNDDLDDDKNKPIEEWNFGSKTTSDNMHHVNVNSQMPDSMDNSGDFVIDHFDPSMCPVVKDENHEYEYEYEEEEEEFYDDLLDDFDLPIKIIGSSNGYDNSTITINVNYNNTQSSGVKIKEVDDTEIVQVNQVSSCQQIVVDEGKNWIENENENMTSICEAEHSAGLAYISGVEGLNVTELLKDISTLPVEALDSFDESDLSDFSDFDEDQLNDDQTIKFNDQSKQVDLNSEFPLLVQPEDIKPNKIKTCFKKIDQVSLQTKQMQDFILEHFQLKEFDDVYKDVIYENNQNINQDTNIEELGSKIARIFDGIDDDLDDLDDEELSNAQANDSFQEDQKEVTEENKDLFNEMMKPSFGELLHNRDENCVSKYEVKFDPMKNDDNGIGPQQSLILQALTMSNASDGINLERLETIGDSFLKYAITCYVYVRYPNRHEGKLSNLRSQQISNVNLYRKGRVKMIGEFMNGTKFEPNDNWCPPCYMPETLQMPKDEKFEDKIPYNLLTEHSIPDKSIADSIEALIGAYLISNGPKGAILLMKWLGLKLTLDNISFEELNENALHPIWRWLPSPPSPLLENPNCDSRESLEYHYKVNRLYDFEEKIKYRFKDKSYLVQAFTHNSFFENRVTDCYQRLEFLGDAVLDYLITRYLYEDPKNHSPGTLTDLRSALVNNTFFASLSVNYNFHKFIKMISPELFKVISDFVNKYKAKEIKMDLGDCMFITEDNYENIEDIEVPKALGDIFESVAGAIYLDSGMSLDTVWSVYFRMMKPEIEYYSENVPKSPIRELLEMVPQHVKFSKPEPVPGKKMVRVAVDVFEDAKFVGVGRNKRIAKITAAKRALRYLKAKHYQSKI